MKKIPLTTGVSLGILPTKKFKTVRFMIRFATLADEKTIGKRMLLCNMLETNSLHYPTQVKLNEKLAEMYGANFSVNVAKRGNLHWLTVDFSVVNPKYVKDAENLLSDAVAFLKEIVFSPNITKKAFDEKTFETEKTNIREYMESIQEDKQSYAALALQELYFADSPEQKIPSFGTMELLERETAASVAAYYCEMIKSNQIDIYVTGEVEEEAIQQLFESWEFTPRAADSGDIFYRQPVVNIIREKIEVQPVVQSKLNIGYNVDSYFQDKEYFALQVFNGIFGGFPHSKLFVNVREKESMAYYASSNSDSFRGFLSVQTGIEGKNREKVLHLIEEQLINIRNGKISETEMLQTKAMLRNQYLLNLDSPILNLEKKYINDLLPNLALSVEEWLARLEAVTKDDVQKVAEKMKKQAIFFLEGAGDQ